MSQWEMYAQYFADGMAYGEYISSAVIIGLCAVGLIVARRMYNRL